MCVSRSLERRRRRLEMGAFHCNALFNKDTGWQIGSVSACGTQPLQVIYERACQAITLRDPGPIRGGR